MFNALLFTFLDLVNDNGSSLLTGNGPAVLTLFLFLERLQSFNLHHEVKALLLLHPLGFELLGLFELLVTDSNDLGVHNHLVHVLNIVVLFVHLGLSLSEET